jgi:hypothetical protein
MKILNRSHLFLSTLIFCAAGLAYSQQPPDVVMSDANDNTAMGTNALLHITTGSYNTAAGFDVLISNTSGFDNTAVGDLALGSNTSGYQNTAFGDSTLQVNTTGINNTAVGDFALYSNETASNNTAFGYAALFSSTIGYDNTAAGMNSLQSNTTGDYNTASGFDALYANTGGNYNTAAGYNTLRNNTSGAQNSASGVQALYGNKTGNYNTASGTDALFSNTTGSTNIAEGYKAGYNLTTGSNNIDIGHLGVAAESDTIRIGTGATHKTTFIAGIYGTSVTGNAVVVSASGQLGVTVSSERYKTFIAAMASNSRKLQQLRPVTFHLKTDPNGALQYGLIAEEVAKVYPELVIRNESGRIDGVRYDELAPMLLNEVQQQQGRIAAQDERIAAQDAAIRELKEQVGLMSLSRGEVADRRDVPLASGVPDSGLARSAYFRSLGSDASSR